MDKNKKLFCNSLKYYLAINNKSRKDLSKDLNISYTTICDWVNGNAIPRSQKVEKIAEYFGIDVSDLYGNKTIQSEEEISSCHSIKDLDNFIWKLKLENLYTPELEKFINDYLKYEE